jgi:hypothetical protein
MWRILSIAFCCSFLFDFIPVLLFAQETALVLVSRGKVESNLDNKKWVAAKRGDRLGYGAKLRTGKASVSILKLSDGSTLRIKPETEIRFIAESDKGSQKSMRNVYLLKGIFAYDVQASPDKPFRFKSPTATAAIKGTTGQFAANKKESSFSVVDSETPGEVAEFKPKKGNAMPLKIGEIAEVSRLGKTEFRQLVQKEMEDFRAEIEDARREMQEELNEMKKELQNFKQESDSLKQNMKMEDIERELEEFLKNDK